MSEKDQAAAGSAMIKINRRTSRSDAPAGYAGVSNWQENSMEFGKA